MDNAVLFGGQVFAGVGWPEEHSHIGPVKMLTAPETQEIRAKVPPQLRMPFVRYTFGAGFLRPAELFRHVDVAHTGATGWVVTRVDVFLLHRMAVANRYGKGNGIVAARAVAEGRARTVKEMLREIEAAFPKIELPPELRSRLARTKMLGPYVSDFAQISAATARPSDCRVRRCGEKAENPAYGGVVCDGCRRNRLQVGIDVSAVLEVDAAPLVAELARPGWILGLAGYPGVWYARSLAAGWAECVARGRFLASGLILDEAPWIFPTRRPVDLCLFRALVADGTAIARLGETEAAIKLALRLDRGPQNAIRICDDLRRYGIARGPLLLNVDDHPDQKRFGVGPYQLRERSPKLHGGGLTLMTVDGTPVVVLSHAAAALARLLNHDTRGMPLSYSVHEGRAPPAVPPGAVEGDAAAGLESMRTVANANSDTVFYVRNAHALTFGLLYHLVETPASIVFVGSKVGKYGFRHAALTCDLGQAWYCVVEAAADAGSNGTLVTSGDGDFDEASLRGMVDPAALGPCSICEVDSDGRDHLTDLIAWANFSVRPKWNCSAPALLRGRSLEEAQADAGKFFRLLKVVSEKIFKE